MYSIKPIGINIKDNDRDVPDGSLQESINMQWRDGAFKPIPERLISEINVLGYKNIIFHKVGDENRINVLGFNQGEGSETFLAFDLADYLGGLATGGNILEWFGYILDGVYHTKTITQLPFVKTPGMSYTTQNGLIYFMGDGSSLSEQYYLKLEFDETTETYNIYDMYRWKTLIPFYPFQSDITLLAPKSTYQAFSQCGLVLIRFALVLKSGEVVLHSPIYANLMYGINRSTAVFAKGDALQNIHTFVNLDLSFLDSDLFDEEVSAINVYASTADYESKFLQGYSDAYSKPYLFNQADIKGKLSKKAEEPFYLVKTIDKPQLTEKILLTVGSFDTDIEMPAGTTYTYSRVDITSIAAGEIMPVDNFTYHKVFGKINSYNGRLVVKRPVTVLSGGHIRALSTLPIQSNESFSMTTEDGVLNGISYTIDRAIEFTETGIKTRGILSYPDIRANLIGANNLLGEDMRMYKCRKNNFHNISCNFNIYNATELSVSFSVDPSDSSKLRSITNYCVYITYDNSTKSIGGDYVNYVVPLDQIDGRDAFEVPDQIDLDKEAYVSSSVFYIRDVDYTVDNAGTGGVGRFVFVVPPTLPFNLSYYTPITSPAIIDVTTISPSDIDANTKYSSENRLQFSQVGEFRVWPALNSYRVGEGKVMSLGIGSVNPSDSFVISPIVVGTTDGTYTINLDPTGNNFISSITPTGKIPFVSEEILEIDNNILFISDQGLIVFQNGEFTNLTVNYFPQQGNGSYPDPETTFPGYDLLVAPFFGVDGNPYQFDDIVRYLKGAILAFDSRRNNVWCSNSIYNYSLVYNLDTKQWSMSTLVFTEKQELFSILETDDGQLYSRYMVRSSMSSYLMILSGEDLTKEVFFHVLTRAIKFDGVDEYKAIGRMVSRSLTIRGSVAAYFALGLWGQQDVNRNKPSIPIALKKDDRVDVFPLNMRYHIPVDCRKGKYRSISLLQSGKALPESYIASFDFDIYFVDNTKMR